MGTLTSCEITHEKTILCFALMIFLIDATFAIPAKPFRLLINKEYKLFDIKSFDELKLVMPMAVLRTAKPIKSITGSKISLKIVIDENHKAKLLWISAVGHQAKRYVIQISQDKETFFVLKEMEIQIGQDERQLYTFVDGRS